MTHPKKKACASAATSATPSASLLGFSWTQFRTSMMTGISTARMQLQLRLRQSHGEVMASRSPSPPTHRTRHTLASMSYPDEEAISVMREAVHRLIGPQPCSHKRHLRRLHERDRVLGWSSMGDSHHSCISRTSASSSRK